MSVSTEAVLADPGPQRRASALSAALAFGWRGMLKVRHVPEQLFEVLAVPVVFTLMFTYLFGGALAGSTSAYLRYLLPGTMVMAVLFVTSYTGIQLNTDLDTGVFDRFRSMPVWRAAPLVGGLLGDAGRYVLSCGVVLALGLAMGYRPPGGVLGVLTAIGLVLVFAVSLSWAWAVLGLLLRTPSTVGAVGSALLIPLTFASNVFVGPQTMPGWLQAFVRVNPAAHLVTAVRGAMDGHLNGGQVGWVLVASAALTLLFGGLAFRLYQRLE